MRANKWLRCLLLIAPVWATVFSASADGSSVQGDVPLYTNADLEKFGTASSAPGQPIAETEAGWRAVQEFLDREYARIEADRAYEQQRLESDRRNALVAAESRRPAGRWILPGLHRFGCGPLLNGSPLECRGPDFPQRTGRGRWGRAPRLRHRTTAWRVRLAC